MSGHVKATLLSLPNELFEFILSNPATLGVRAGRIDGNRWHAINYIGDDDECDPHRDDSTHDCYAKEMLRDLRWVSHTCKRLRSVALPLIWKVVHVETVEELGKVRDQLRMLPSIAKYIRHFEFVWDMPDPSCDVWPKEHGNLLDMAFIDRGKVWDRMRKMWRCRVVDGDYFEYKGVRYGPDGQGTDRRIRGPKEFKDALTEIVTRLTSSEAFRWRCTTTPMPEGVFKALKKLPRLEVLGLTLSLKRSEVRLLPYWELASKLTTLSIDDGQCGDFFGGERVAFADRTDPVPEEELTSFELPSPVPLKSSDDFNGLLASVACRTIVTAARGGHLKCLDLGPRRSMKYEKAFTIRALLPVWVRIEKWHFEYPTGPSAKSWVYAAWSLRPSLAHISNINAPSRQLSGANVQAMHAHFQGKDLPSIAHIVAPDPVEEGSPFDSYLTWLRDDADLAQQVADAWNDSLARGQADA